MIEGADSVHIAPNTHHIEIVEQGLLVEPGRFCAGHQAGWSVIFASRVRWALLIALSIMPCRA